MNGQQIVDKFIHRYGRLPTEVDPDYLEMLRMSKYRILAVPDSQPGKCANCGSSKEDGRKYIDFGLYVDWYGVVIICTQCFTHIGTESGLFDAFTNEIERLKKKLTERQGLFDQGVALQETILHTYEEVKSYFTTLPATVTDSTTDSDPVLDTEKSNSESGADSAESGTSVGKPEVAERTTKSSTSRRSTNVPSFTELLKS